jgi:hypothetical protein
MTAPDTPSATLAGALRLALALERQRTDAATQSRAVTRQLVDGLLKLAPEDSCPEVLAITAALTGEEPQQ